ncbi:MAG: hypothetical protein C4581_05330 [Nitrospiraceae bacterium]|nr:MAG: hypothetical protein C4581_05330 [Nitrospiraceae bacterium]
MPFLHVGNPSGGRLRIPKHRAQASRRDTLRANGIILNFETGSGYFNFITVFYYRRSCKYD